MQQGYGFLGILVRNRVLILSIVVSERVWLLYFCDTGKQV